MINYTVTAAGERGIQRIFSCAGNGSPERAVLSAAGFSLYAREDIYRLDAAPRDQAQAPSGIRPEQSSDLAGINRLYTEITPHLVQQAESPIGIGTDWLCGPMDWRPGRRVCPGRQGGHSRLWILDIRTHRPLAAHSRSRARIRSGERSGGLWHGPAQLLSAPSSLLWSARVPGRRPRATGRAWVPDVLFPMPAWSGIQWLASKNRLAAWSRPWRNASRRRPQLSRPQNAPDGFKR